MSSQSRETVCKGMLFITGTDTGVGKTVVTLGLMHRLQSMGCQVAGMKPVASGCERSADGLRNGDALALQRHSSIDLTYEAVNPCAYAPPVAPHIAAQEVGHPIHIGTLAEQARSLAGRVDCLLIEGVGGWRVPVSEHQTMADLARGLGIAVVLVVGVRLGCLNHALLTTESILSGGLSLAGWVANVIPPEPERMQQNIDTLRMRIPAPLLAIIPPLKRPDAESVAGSFSSEIANILFK